MPYVKRIVCLANSKKTGGRCIAGKEIIGGCYGSWIRPVSARLTAEVFFAEFKYHDNEVPKLLDIIDVPLLNANPQNHQTENHVIDPTVCWTKVGTLPWRGLQQLLDRPASLWINRDSTQTGRYNCMSPAEAATLQDSLALIRPENFVIEVGSRTWDGIRKKTYRGNFRYNGTDYSLSVTDPVALSAVSGKEEGEYPLNDVYLCVSLTEPYPEDGRCHKLVAAVLTNLPM